MEKAKYLEWIIANVEADPKVKEYLKEHPQTGENVAMYHITHLARIAGQYERLDDAKSALNNLKKQSEDRPPISPPTSDFPFSASGDGGSQVQSFGDYLDGVTVVFGNQQRLIPMDVFFREVFPRLRPGQEGYLPSLYRNHIQTSGLLGKEVIHIIVH